MLTKKEVIDQYLLQQEVLFYGKDGIVLKKYLQKHPREFQKNIEKCLDGIIESIKKELKDENFILLDRPFHFSWEIVTAMEKRFLNKAHI